MAWAKVISRRFSYLFALRPPCPPLTGYLANWKMFEPKKLIPPSMELWSAPIAVMTEMTEKTPIVIPIMVNPERNLFAPNDSLAMASISRNSITALYQIGRDSKELQESPPELHTLAHEGGRESLLKPNP